MGFLDKLLGREDEAKAGVDKAAEVADEKTGGEHTDTIDTGAEKAKDAIDDVGDGSN